MVKIDEKTLEDLLFDALHTSEGTEKLCQRGLDFTYNENNMLFRQFNTKEYGIMDMMKISFSGRYVYVDIIELKVVDFDLSHLIQLGRYIAFVRQIIKANDIKDRVLVKGTLIVANFDSDKDYVWMDSIISSYIKVYKTSYTIDGLCFDQVMPMGWHLRNTELNINKYIDLDELKCRFKAGYKELQNQPF